MKLKNLINFFGNNNEHKFSNLKLAKYRQLINGKHLNKINNELESSSLWSQYFLDFKKIIESEAIHKFLKSELVNKTMFYVAPFSEFIKIIMHFNFFRYALISNNVGSPNKYAYLPITNGNTIHHLYSISQIITNKNELSSYDLIIEFGGGYGNMAWCFNKLGFKGRYIIFDNEFMNVLQQMFLDESSVIQSTSSVFAFISDVDQLINIINNASSRTLLIGTWSISETPLHLRNKIMINTKIDMLIAFQREFDGMDNLDFFGNYISINDLITQSKIFEIKHIPDNYYFIKTASD